jgi:hypothetical protein
MIVLEPYIFKGFYEYDRELGFKVRSHVNGTNRFGFNDRDYSLTKPEGIVRVLVVGDSFGWAGGVDENYTAILEKQFEDHYGRHRVDVINAGYPMTHTGEQLAMLKKYGLQYQPDMVFLGFFVGNDFIDADPYRKRIVVNDTYFDIDKRREKTFLGYPIIGKSRLWHFIRQKLVIWKELNKAGTQEVTQTPKLNPKSRACTFSEEAFLYIERVRIEICNVQSNQLRIYREKIEFILHSLSQMQELLARNQTKLIVGIYPDEFQINAQLRSQIFENFGLKKELYDIDFMQNLLAKYLEAHQIPYLDLLDAFRSRGKTEPLYLCRNTHWNQAGNELAANMIFQYLLPHVESVMQKKP